MKNIYLIILFLFEFSVLAMPSGRGFLTGQLSDPNDAVDELALRASREADFRSLLAGTTELQAQLDLMQTFAASHHAHVIVYQQGEAGWSVIQEFGLGHASNFPVRIGSDGRIEVGSPIVALPRIRIPGDPQGPSGVPPQVRRESTDSVFGRMVSSISDSSSPSSPDDSRRPSTVRTPNETQPLTR